MEAKESKKHGQCLSRCLHVDLTKVLRQLEDVSDNGAGGCRDEGVLVATRTKSVSVDKIGFNVHCTNTARGFRSRRERIAEQAHLH